MVFPLGNGPSFSRGASVTAPLSGKKLLPPVGFFPPPFSLGAPGAPGVFVFSLSGVISLSGPFFLRGPYSSYERGIV